LQTGQLGATREWRPMGAIAAVVDWARVSLDWSPKTNWEPNTSQIILMVTADRASAAIPAPFRGIVDGLETSSDWARGQSLSRWYAPTDDGIGVVVFQDHHTLEYNGGASYAPGGKLTCFDPRVRGKVRWERSLAAVYGANDGEIFSFLPLFSPWGSGPTLLVEYVYGTKGTTKYDGVKIRLGRIDLRDGHSQTVGTIPDDGRLGLVAARRWWPRTSTDGDRVVYMTQPKRGRHSLVEYSVTQGRLLGDLPCPSSADRLLTVTPAEEAIVLDDDHLWAIGCGQKNRGRVRQVTNFFINSDR
jgi:hypothetical protein